MTPVHDLRPLGPARRPRAGGRVHERSWTFCAACLVHPGPQRRPRGPCPPNSRDIRGRRASIWLHDRRTRQLVLSASSDAGTAPRRRAVPIDDTSALPAAGCGWTRRSLRETRAVVIAPLRGWRRALGTLVIEGPHRRRRSTTREFLEFARELGAAAVGRDRERPAARRHPPSAAPARGHLQFARRSRRRHGRRARIVQTNEAFAARVGLTRADLLGGRSPSSSGARRCAYGRSRRTRGGGSSPSARAYATVEHRRSTGSSS